MANNGSGTAMKSVIAQLGERQQLQTSKVAANDRPSRAAVKPLPAGKKPIGTGSPGPNGRVPVKPAPSTAKPTVPAPQSATSSSNKRPPITAQKSSDMSQPAAALSGQKQLLTPSRLKPTVPAKSPVVSPSSVSTPSVSESGDEATTSPPWQNLVMKKKNAPPTPVKKRESATSVTQTTAIETASYADVEVTVDSSTVDDSRQMQDSEQSSTEDPGSSAVAKVHSLKQVFEGASHSAAAETSQSNKRASSGRGGTLKKISGTSTEARPDDNSQSGVDRTLPSASHDKPCLPLADSSSSLPRQSVSRHSRRTTTNQKIVVGADGRSYHRLPPPGEPTTRPARKPAKPPVVDLTPYLSFAAPSTFVQAVDDDIYDDASSVGLPLTDNDDRVTLRSSVTRAGRQNASLVVSHIAEYTEEEEEMEKQTWKNSAVSNTTAAACQLVSQSSDEIYDDVGTTEQTDVLYEDDEIYQEID